MEKPRYYYNVQYEEIRPLPTGETWAAKVTHIIIKRGDSSRKINIPHYEWWGMTREDAAQKARTEADAWIEKNIHKYLDE